MIKKHKPIYALIIVAFIIYLIFANQITSLFITECFKPTGNEIKSSSDEIPKFYIDSTSSNDGSFLELTTFLYWTTLPTTRDNSNKQIGIVLSNDSNTYSHIIKPNAQRKDVVAEGIKGIMHGGHSNPSTILVKDGTYRIGVYCYENEFDYGYADTEYILTKKGTKTTIGPWHSQEIDINPDLRIDTASTLCIDGSKINDNGDAIINAWAFIPEQNPKESQTYVMLTHSDGTVQIFDTCVHNRPDLTAAFGDEMYANAGFNAIIPAQILHSKEYEVSVVIEDGKGLHTSEDMLSVVQSGLDAKKSAESNEASDNKGIVDTLAIPLIALMNLLHKLFKNYGLTILVFTLLSKIILLPVSLWVHKNGIVMVKITPELNKVKINHFGDKDAIDDATQALYKREKYNPLASTVPMIVQILMLLGVIAG